MNNFSGSGVESHIKRVERWLKRCVAACKCGSWSDALSEAECLEAETKGLREKLWRTAGDEAVKAGKLGISGWFLHRLKIVVLAMIIVMAAVFPIAMDMERAGESFSYVPESLELLTSTESDIINALRASLSNSNHGKVVLTVEIPAAEIFAETPKGAAMASEKRTPAMKNLPDDRNQVDGAVKDLSPRRPSADEVISLIQVGQRALRVSEPGVKILE